MMGVFAQPLEKGIVQGSYGDNLFDGDLEPFLKDRIQAGEFLETYWTRTIRRNG